MSTLLLRIDLRLESGGRAPHVPVKIYPARAATNSGERASTISTSIALSDRDEDATAVSLNPGRYYVESVLPSGETLADDVIVSEGGTTRLVLKSEMGAEEWLSWQDFSGNVAVPAPPPASVNLDLLMSEAVQTGRSSIVRDVGPRIPGLARIGPFHRPSDTRLSDAAAKPRGSVPRADRVNLHGPIGLLRHTNPILQYLGSPHSVWQWLKELNNDTRGGVIFELNRGLPLTPIDSSARNASQAVFRLNSQSISRKRPLQSNYHARFSRAFVVVPRLRSIELLSLPMPWATGNSADDATIEVGTRQQRSVAAFCSSIVVQDSQFGILLSYLSVGALPTARAMAEPALNYLRYKYKNPFAAAAGGYALVGTISQTRQEKWHGWIHNLMEGFPAIPDGAILWAQLNLRMRRNESDIREASKALKLAFRVGIPFYSMGVKWLMEGLEAISHQDREAAQMLDVVRAIAWRTNYQQAFTILRIGGMRDV